MQIWLLYFQFHSWVAYKNWRRYFRSILSFLNIRKFMTDIREVQTGVFFYLKYAQMAKFYSFCMQQCINSQRIKISVFTYFSIDVNLASAWKGNGWASAMFSSRVWAFRRLLLRVVWKQHKLIYRVTAHIMEKVMQV